MSFEKKCPNCKGSGWINITYCIPKHEDLVLIFYHGKKICPMCKGTGVLKW